MNISHTQVCREMILSIFWVILFVKQCVLTNRAVFHIQLTRNQHSGSAQAHSSVLLHCGHD